MNIEPRSSSSERKSPRLSCYGRNPFPLWRNNFAAGIQKDGGSFVTYGRTPLSDRPAPKINFLDRDGARLAHIDAGTAISPALPIVFVHGWCCDHTFFAPQISHFAGTHRVIAVDLRGHGKSDAPKQDYTTAGFADDVAWQCRQLGLEKPVIIGHSMGGNVALEFAARHPESLTAIMMIDSLIFPPPSFIESLAPLGEALRTTDYLSALQAAASGLFIESDDPARKEALLKECAKTPQHVIASAFVHNVIAYDTSPAAKACKVPVAYIAAPVPLVDVGRDLDRFKEACPQLLTARIIGAGHFAQLEVPDQINAMIERFLAVGIRRH
jgi:pimeloyl-ACP methyl ester carboxylesterase